MPLAAGTRIGSYEVVSAIGAGGMGEVYRARDARLNRDIALKVLPAVLADDPERLARFRREAQVLASLNHPNIATVHGFEESGSIRALVMELVDGQTLAEMMSGAQGSAMPLAESLPIARQIAEALEAAHEQGIVHRDLKPANVKVRSDGTVKVLDFGLAKALGGGADDPASGVSDAMNSPTLTARATQLGVILGTAAYMSPEQAKGKPVDRRADIWAFGVVLYELLTGRRGYHAEDISDTLAAVLTRDVDWSQLPSDTPPRLQQLLRDCLVRDPKQRLRDIGEARRAIEQVISGARDASLSGLSASGSIAGSQDTVSVKRAGSIDPASTTSWQRLLPWAVAAIAIAVAAFQALQLTKAPAAADAAVTRSRAPLRELSGFVALSRDGSKLAYTVTGGQRGFTLALRQMDQFDGKLIPGTEGGIFPIFSPDGQSIAYMASLTEGRIRRISISGGSSVAVSEGALVDGGDWGDDDTIVFSGKRGLLRVPANGGTPQELTRLNEEAGETAHQRPQFLPGGGQVLFTVISKSSERPQFAVADVKTGSYRTVAPGGFNGRYAPSGHLTFRRDNTVFAVPFDLGQLTVTGPEVPVIESISTTGPAGTADYAFSRNGVLVYSEGLSGQGTTLAWADRQGKVTAIPHQEPRKWGTGQLSPDGRHVATGLDTDKGRDIWIVDLDRGTPNRVTFGGQNDRPVWTSDGKRVFFGGTATDGKSGLYVVPADASAPPSLVLELKSAPVVNSVGVRDTKLLYRFFDEKGRARMFLLELSGNAATAAPRPLREGTGSDVDAEISPDGKWVALTSTETGGSEVYVMPFPGPGGRTRISSAGGREPRWSPSGRELFYRGGDAGAVPTFVVSVQTSPSLTVSVPSELFRSMFGTTWDLAPDGKLLVETVRNEGELTSFATVTNWFEELKRRAPARK